MKKYDTPHRRRVIKTRLTGEEYAEFSEGVTPCKMSQAGFIRQRRPVGFAQKVFVLPQR